jgi:endo-1,4-beta-mannosidase
MDHFNNGVNLGGWLSQYSKYSHEHFQTFISEADIALIASWGMDHIRLPFDYPVLESNDAPGVYRQDGFAYIDHCLEWCKKHGLGVILDLHHAPGYTFTNTLRPETQHLNVLFDQENAQQRFIALWEEVVRRYHRSGLPVIFELLNEVVLPDSTLWNSLAGKTVSALRKIDPECKVMIGGNHYNAASELKNITLLDDPNVSYTFHFYEPLLFTHQKAPWTQVAREYNQTLDYPGSYVGLKEFLDRSPQFQKEYGWQVGWKLDRSLMLEFLQPALDFANQTGRDLYCGEFGVISGAPAASRRHWHADLVDILRQHNIGHGLWSYKAMDFGLVDRQGIVVDPELIKIVVQN